MKVKLRKIGISIFLELPKKMLKRLGVSEGDEISVIETPEGLLLTSARIRSSGASWDSASSS